VPQRQLVTGLAVAFGTMTALFVVGGAVYNLLLFVPAVVFGAVTYVLYAHATGRLLDRIYRGVERQAATGADPRSGGFGAGPREEWTPPRDEQTRRRVRQESRQRGRARGRGERVRQAPRGPTPREASEVLGVDPGADERAVRQAYRSRIKEVHPDAADGDEEEFKRVQEAYEVLTE